MLKVLPRLVDRRDAGDEDHDGDHHAAHVLVLAVAVCVLVVGRIIGETHRNHREGRADQVGPGVERLGENTHGPRLHVDEDLEQDEDGAAENRPLRRPPFERFASPRVIK